MQQPCPNRIVTCPNGDADDDILGNYTAELPDKPTFWGVGYPKVPGSLPIATCESDVSQTDADLCAQKTLVQSNPLAPASPPTNDEQSCSATCLDGTIVTFTVAAGTFAAPTLAAANAMAQSYACDIAPTLCPELFTSSPQTCVATCGDGSTQTYTAPAGLFVGITQQAADAAAHNFACAAASSMCNSGGVAPTLRFSDVQRCDYHCPSGQVIHIEVHASLFPGLSQGDANATARAFACQLAAALCQAVPPLPTNTAQTCTITCRGSSLSYTVSAGTFQAPDQATANATAQAFACQVVNGICDGTIPPGVINNQLPRGNSAQNCPFTCANGTVFTYFVPPGSFLADNAAAANAMAHSYACQQAAANPRCLSDIQAIACLGVPYAQVISLSGAGPASLELSGTLPPGMFFEVNVLSGTPTVGGTYSFTVTAQTQAGHTAVRTYSLTVAGITTTSLPPAIAGTPYSSTLAQSGMTNPVWSLTGGALPAGLTLTNTGVISGTPTTTNPATFTVSITENGLTCDKTLTISSSGYLWWKMEEASGDRIDSIQGVPMSGFAVQAPGKILKAAGFVLDGSTSAGAGVGLTAALATTNAGWTLVGWINKSVGVDVDPKPAISVSYLSPIGIQQIFLLLGSFTGGGVNIDWIDNTGTPFDVHLEGDPGINTWFFFRMWFDPVAQIIGVQINNGTKHTVSGGIDLTATAALFFDVSPAVGHAVNAYLDEFGFFPFVLHDSQAAYIYNGGAGRTSPISFP